MSVSRPTRLLFCWPRLLFAWFYVCFTSCFLVDFLVARLHLIVCFSIFKGFRSVDFSLLDFVGFRYTFRWKVRVLVQSPSCFFSKFVSLELAISSPCSAYFEINRLDIGDEGFYSP